jgi:hypothetical protein
VVSFPLTLPPIIYKHSSSPPFVLQGPPTLDTTNEIIHHNAKQHNLDFHSYENDKSHHAVTASLIIIIIIIYSVRLIKTCYRHYKTRVLSSFQRSSRLYTRIFQKKSIYTIYIKRLFFGILSKSSLQFLLHSIYYTIYEICNSIIIFSFLLH